MRYAHVLAALNEPWAIEPAKFDQIRAVVRERLAGAHPSPEDIRARIGTPEAARPAPRRAGAVQVIPIYGVLAQRMGLMSEISGGTSTDQVGQAIRQAIADPSVQAILLDIDSPGGEVYGTPELAQAIHDARGSKRIVALANSFAASAAYWIGSQADEFLMAPSAMAGSIGVIAQHEDWSKAAETAGVKMTFLTSSPYKAEMNQFEPLSAAARDALQATVNEYGTMFVKAVAQGRGVSQAKVREEFGQGRMLTASEAVKVGLADGIATFDETLARLASGKRATAMAAEAAAAYQVRGHYLDRL